MSGSCRVAAGGIEVQEEHIRHSQRRCLEIKSELGDQMPLLSQGSLCFVSAKYGKTCHLKASSSRPGGCVFRRTSMRSSSETSSFVRMGFVVCAIVVALGFYGIVHAQSATPTVTIPLRPLAPLSTVKIPPVFGLEGILADKVAA